MATIHPSRLGLVPQDPRDSRGSRRPRSDSRSPVYSKPRPRSRSRGRGRSEARDAGRRSPRYEDYKKPEDNAPWRQQENMYPERRGRQPPSGNWGGGDYIKSRQEQRDSNTFSIWPPSPKGPARELSPGHKSHKRSKKRDRSPSTSPSEASSDEDRRRKEKRSKRRKEKEERRSHKKKHRRHHSSEDDRERRRSRSRSKSHRDRTPSRSRTKTRSPPASEDEWVEKGGSAKAFVDLPVPSTSKAAEFSKHSKQAAEDDDSDVEVGPQPLTKATNKVDERAYGSALLRGEGSAMAAFLTDDTGARIPRRGEIGLTSDEIAKFEDVGYVMSGSRHRRMNAVRIRKENQVISAEEKRGILKLQKEERERREEVLREEFKSLLDEKIKAAGSQKPAA
ncbi:hypothetical protein M422DRAFT_27737 [Sphaerobolus stellatus SS14]|nr:hypothetical protein M422DRAFT_27737 [Sphaerobolus stellatus SS14]